MRPFRPIPVLLAQLLLLVGCTGLWTEKSQYSGTERMLERGDYAAAIAKIEAAKEDAYTRKDRVVYYLDIGMLYHWDKDYQKSNEMLERAERAIEENFTKSLSRSASSLIMNDNVLAYAGESYEDVYLNAFKALNYLELGQYDDAFVEVRRLENKLVHLEGKYSRVARKMSEAEEAPITFFAGKNPFQESALGRYLGMMLYRRDGKWDDVRIDREKINRAWRVQPSIYTFPEPNLSAMTERVHPPMARLNIIAFSGQAPDKQAETFYLHSEEDLIVFGNSAENYLGKQELVDLSVLPWEGIEPGYHFKIQLPEMVRLPSRVARISVSVQGVPATLQPLESLENAAIETFGVEKPLIYLKTISRAIAKGLAAEQAKHELTSSMDEAIAFFTRLATDLLVDTSENADLRVSRFFPGLASVRELHLREGSYDIRVNYYDSAGKLLHADSFPGFEVKAGQINLVESAYLN